MHQRSVFLSNVLSTTLSKFRKSCTEVCESIATRNQAMDSLWEFALEGRWISMAPEIRDEATKFWLYSALEQVSSPVLVQVYAPKEF